MKKLITEEELRHLAHLVLTNVINPAKMHGLKVNQELIDLVKRAEK